MFAKKREVCFHERGGSGKEGEFGCQLGLELGGRRASGRRTFEPVVLVLSRHGGGVLSVGRGRRRRRGRNGEGPVWRAGSGVRTMTG